MRQADVPHCLPAWVQREQPIDLTGQLPARRLHPVPVRIMHWTNAAAMLVMIGSGWGIYNDSVILSALHFSKHVKLGSWAAASLLWHFAGMWLLVLNGAAYLVYGIVTGRLRERLLPIRLPDLVQTVRDTLRFKVAHQDLTTYNAVQKLLYIIVILAGVAGRDRPGDLEACAVRRTDGAAGRLPGPPACSTSPAWPSSSASSWSTSRCRCWCPARSGPC